MGRSQLGLPSPSEGAESDLCSPQQLCNQSLSAILAPHPGTWARPSWQHPCRALPAHSKLRDAVPVDILDNRGWRHPARCLRAAPCTPSTLGTHTPSPRLPWPRWHSLLVGRVLLPLRLPAGGGEMERMEPVSSSWEQPAWMARR